MNKHTGLDFADMMFEQHGEAALEVALETVRQVHIRRMRQTATKRSRPFRPQLTAEQKSILEAVCTYFSLVKADLLGRGRPTTVCLARRVCWALMRDMLEMSFAEIGILFDRDHTSVMSGLEHSDARGVYYADVKRLLASIQPEAAE